MSAGTSGDNSARATRWRRLRKQPTVIWRIVWCAAMTFCATARAGDLLPANLRAAILARALGYEKSFSSEKASATLLVISGGPGAADAKAVTAALEPFVRGGSVGRPVALDSVDLAAASIDELKRRGATVIFVPAGNREIYTKLADFLRVIVLCSDPADVGQGCMLSVEVAGKTSRLVVDAVRAERAQVRFDARMLRLARVTR